MRISTAMIFESGLASIQRRTADLLRTQQQLSTGRRILSPSDDPVGAARALELTQARDANANQEDTRNRTKSIVGIAESQLQSANDLLARIRELSVQGANASLSGADRRSVAAELRARFDELIGIANASDGLGNFIFAGFQTGGKPFAGTVEQGVVFAGDDGFQALQVSAARQMGVTQSGDDIFMRIKNGNGTFATRVADSAPITLHSLSIGDAQITDPVDWLATTTPDTMTLSFFTDETGRSFYDIADASGLSLFTGTPSAAPTHGTLTGNADFVTLPAVITAGVNDTLSVSVDGAASAVTIPPGSYTQPQLVETLQGLFDAAGTGVTVSAAGNGLKLTSNTFGVTSAVTAPGGSAVATVLGGAPAIVAGAAGTYGRQFVSGQPIALSSAGPLPFDFGARVTVSGTPRPGDSFVIERDDNDEMRISRETITHASATIGKGQVLDPLKWTQAANSQNLEIRFQTNAAGTAFYDIVDATTGMSLVAGTPSLRSTAGTLSGDADISMAGNITAANNVLSLDIDGVTRTITIPPGNYAPAALAAEVQRQFDAIPAGVVVSTDGTTLSFASTTLGTGTVALTVPAPANDAAPALIGTATTTVPVAGTYGRAFESGTAIALADTGFDFGATVTVTGTPADGDVFTIGGDTIAAHGNGWFVTGEQSIARVNTGTGVIGTGEVRNAALWQHPANSRQIDIRFHQDTSDTRNPVYYDLVDLETGKSLFTDSPSVAGGAGSTFTHVFKSGDSIALNGLNVPWAGPPASVVTDFGVAVTIQGTPANGDSFRIEPAKSQSVFDTIANAIQALESGAPQGTAGNTWLANQMNAVLDGVSRAEDSVLTARATFGARLAEVDTLDNVGSAMALQYETSLSQLQDLDYAEAITRLSQREMELQAAQASFARISQLSLFDYLR